MSKPLRNRLAISAPLLLAGAWLMKFITVKLRGRLAPKSPAPAAQDPAEVGLTQMILKMLPRDSHHFIGRPMESMNLVLVGSEDQIRAVFKRAGWYEAHPVAVLNLLRAQLSLIIGIQYKRGPVTPLFVGNQVQTMAFQKPTKLNKFKQRHHTRIWPTEHLDKAKLPVWIAQASYDIDIKSIFQIPPAHRIDPDIDAERDLIVRDLKDLGAELRGYIQLQDPHEGFNAFDDPFTTDGRAAVVEVKS